MQNCSNSLTFPAKTACVAHFVSLSPQKRLNQRRVHGFRAVLSSFIQAYWKSPGFLMSMLLSSHCTVSRKEPCAATIQENRADLVMLITVFGSHTCAYVWMYMCIRATKLRERLVWADYWIGLRSVQLNNVPSLCVVTSATAPKSGCSNWSA